MASDMFRFAYIYSLHPDFFAKRHVCQKMHAHSYFLRYSQLFFFFLMLRPPPRSTLSPYPTLSRSERSPPADPERDERAFSLLKKRPPFLSASPTPVPAQKGAGNTTFSWDTADGSIGKVFVSI